MSWDLDKECCGNCRFARPARGPDWCQCRRRAPMADQRSMAPVWPLMHGERDWCGEFEHGGRDGRTEDR